MSNYEEANPAAVPPLETWRTTLQPQGLADRLHAAVVVALKIAASAGYRVTSPGAARTQFEIEQVPSEDWAQPRAVKEAVELLELANAIVPLLAADPSHPNGALMERCFKAGELTARMPAWEGVNLRGGRG